MLNPSPDFFMHQTTDFKSVPVRMHASKIGLFCSGIFDGATVRLEVSPERDLAQDPDTMEWFDHPEGIFTDATETEQRFWNNADLAEVWVRGVLENAGGNTDLTFRARTRPNGVV